jgi:chromosome partitioning protein
VAIAHQELDNVLPPTVAGSKASTKSSQKVSTAPEAGTRLSDEAAAPPSQTAPPKAPPPQSSPPKSPPAANPPAKTPARPPGVSGGQGQDTLAEARPEEASPEDDRARVRPREVTPEPDATPESATEDWEAQAASGNALPRVMAVANQKGGVGKTTTSVNLGAALAELGFRVLVIDLDPQANATTGLGIDARTFEISMYDVLMRDTSLEDCVEPTSMKNLFVAPATIALAGAEIELVPAFSRELKLKKSIEAVIEDFDYVLIDCPPSLGLITINALAAAHEVLVPIQCEYYALEGLSQLMRNVHLVASNLNPRLDISTIVLTMYDARTKLADQVAAEVRKHFGPKVCRIVIPRTVRLSEAPSFGQPITTFDPGSRGAVAYRELAKEVSGGTP